MRIYAVAGGRPPRAAVPCGCARAARRARVRDHRTRQRLAVARGQGHTARHTQTQPDPPTAGTSPRAHAPSKGGLLLGRGGVRIEQPTARAQPPPQAALGQAGVGHEQLVHARLAQVPAAAVHLVLQLAAPPPAVADKADRGVRSASPAALACGLLGEACALANDHSYSQRATPKGAVKFEAEEGGSADFAQEHSLMSVQEFSQLVEGHYD